MNEFNEGLLNHLETGSTTTCRCWGIERKDGRKFGFTDHDRSLAFDGFTFKADTGLSASAFQQSTGLAVDNSEAIGALSDASLREEDIQAGRFDGAQVHCWLVNWSDIAQRQLLFRGAIGELRRNEERFEAELRGLSDGLSRPLGRVYNKHCTAVLGDGRCHVDLDQASFSMQTTLIAVGERRIFKISDDATFEEGWFRHGGLYIQSGAGLGLSGAIKRDYRSEGSRIIELWHPLRAEILAGDEVRIEAGCDKLMRTCEGKFNNLLNFQGFPDIPGDEWSISRPDTASDFSGGSRRG